MSAPVKIDSQSRVPVVQDWAEGALRKMTEWGAARLSQVSVVQDWAEGALRGTTKWGAFELSREKAGKTLTARAAAQPATTFHK